MIKKTTKLLLLLISLYSIPESIYSQCNVEYTLLIDDMINEDIDNDGTPDGIINLAAKYLQNTGSTLESGTWSITNNELSLPLDSSTGNVALWEYSDSSANLAIEYKYQLFTSTCGTDPAITITMELCSFSGVALPPGPNGVNLEVCDHENVDEFAIIDLYESLTSDESTPSPHLNGTWELLSSPSNALNSFLSSDGTFTVDMEYQPGIPLIDKGEFQFRYVVGSTDNCTEQETFVTVSVVRQVDSGEARPTPFEDILLICESAINNGDHDADIDLRDDMYLVGEDIEGFWTSLVPDIEGGIGDVFDSVINIKTIYDNLIVTQGLRFGSERYTFNYQVNQRSGVCIENDNTNIELIIYEELRPFNQNTNNAVFCLEDTSSVELFDLLEFTNEGGIDFIYPNNDGGTSWTVISTPGSQVIDMSNSSPSTKGIFLLTQGGEYIEPGIYTFRFSVDSSINSQAGHGSSKCESLDTLITVEILPFDYAGENNTELIELCETQESVILTSLLDVDDAKGPVAISGVWTDGDGVIYNNNFTFPDIDADTNYVLNYNTTHPVSGCVDDSQLTFTIINEKSPGSTGESITADGIVKLCTDDLSVVLFDQLQNADPIGQWTGPAGYVSADHLGTFVFNDQTQEDIKEGEYVYTIDNNEFCTSVETIALTIQFVTPLELATTVTRSYCQNEGSIDLLTLLEVSAPKDGVFTDLDATGALTGSVVDFSGTGVGEFNFSYTLDLAPCDNPTQNFVIQVLDGSEAPFAGDDPINPIRVCSDNLTIKLFEQLGGTPSMSGTWSGDFGYESNDYEGTFIDGDPALQILGEGTYTYTVGGGICNAPLDTATVIIEIIEPIELGENVFRSFCKLEGGVNLFSLLDENTTAQGEFTDTDVTNSLTDEGFFDFSGLAAGVYNFQYSIPNEAPCDVSSLNVEINVFETPAITGAEKEFCVLDAKKLNDIEVYYTIPSTVIGESPTRIDVGNENVNWYSSLQSDEPIISNPKLVDGAIYYVANIGDADGEECESERFAVEVNILNVSEKSSSGTIECPLEFQDGVSADGNNINDTFSLNWKDENYNIAIAFPDFELEIYNRYGVVVYKGNSNTSEFKGDSNVSLSIGSDLPSGVYFYIFKPNFKSNAPIQGSFYLSK